VTDTPSLLAERARTHGDFRSTAWVAQTLRDTFRHELGWRDLSTVHREALDSMAVKIARILSGWSVGVARSTQARWAPSLACIRI
jgi:hypothetical protein